MVVCNKTALPTHCAVHKNVHLVCVKISCFKQGIIALDLDPLKSLWQNVSALLCENGDAQTDSVMQSKIKIPQSNIVPCLAQSMDKPAIGTGKIDKAIFCNEPKPSLTPSLPEISMDTSKHENHQAQCFQRDALQALNQNERDLRQWTIMCWQPVLPCQNFVTTSFSNVSTAESNGFLLLDAFCFKVCTLVGFNCVLSIFLQLGTKCGLARRISSGMCRTQAPLSSTKDSHATTSYSTVVTGDKS